MTDALISRLRELAGKAKQAEAECLISEERSPGGTVTRIYKHPCSPESSRSVLADSAFSDALVSAWPSLLSRLEAGEALAEAVVEIENEAGSHTVGEPLEASGFGRIWLKTRAALAAYAAAKKGAPDV